jgi:perosamine synthetase
MIRYPVAAPDLGGREKQYVNECLDTTWISSAGRFIGDFEAALAQYTGAAHAIVCSNGTVALHLAMHMLDLQPGDEVIVPSLTYVATANAVAYCGATPVFADSEPDTWCISPASIERLIGPRTRAIVPVHLYGHPCDMEAIGELAAKHGLAVVEDAAESLGSTLHERHTGTFGQSGIFSFFGNKTITTGEGGAIVTDDGELAARIRLHRGQGMDPSRRYWHTVIGFNFRMTNIEAAIGLAQMERIDDLVGRRRAIAKEYCRHLSRRPGLQLPIERAGVHSSFWMTSVLVPPGVSRDGVMADMSRRGVETRPIFYPVHEFPMYRHCRTDRHCPMAVEIARRGLSLPTSTYLSDDDIAEISDHLLAAVDNVGAVRRAA